MTATPETGELWADVAIDPIKVALPNGMAGYTLRAHRPASELTPTEPTHAEAVDDDPFAERERARAAEDALLDPGLDDAADEASDEASDDEPAGEPAGEPGGDELTDTDQPPVDEEVPVFLSHRGRLLLFGTPQSLVSFIGSDAPHDLAQLDTWPVLAKRIRPTDVVPTDEDSYELDLVVENLRGGHDAWDLPLLISAGELARDLGHALRLQPVITAMAGGSPLDDLDEALRATAGGGVGALFAKRRLRRTGAQQASLGWRTVIGKITDAVDWRD